MANGENTAHHPNRRVDATSFVNRLLGRNESMKLEKLPRSERRKNAAEQQAPASEPAKSAAPYPQPKGLEIEPMPDLSGKTPLDRNKYA